MPIFERVVGLKRLHDLGVVDPEMFQYIACIVPGRQPHHRALERLPCSRSTQKVFEVENKINTVLKR